MIRKAGKQQTQVISNKDVDGDSKARAQQLIIKNIVISYPNFLSLG